ncbi:MAG TPA: spiro-SPASM protein [Spirochaetota bacterium]|nr:spiro-SPASM protein [Spirochaetota bacterium]
MNNAFVLYLEKHTDDDDLNFNGSKTFDIIKEKINSAFADTEIIASLPEAYTGDLDKFSKVYVRSDNETENWKNLNEQFSFDNYIRIKADAPFCDMQIVGEMLDVHTKYIAEYTYSENIPAGFACDILSSELIKSLPDSSENGKSILPVEKVIKDNINQFDVELFYKEPDIRAYRLSFLSGDKRENMIMQNMIKVADNISYDSVEKVLTENPDVLYTTPSYIEIELSPETNANPLYSPITLAKKERSQMDSELFDKIITELDLFKPPVALSLSGFGEPLKHSEFYSIFEKALNNTNISILLLETDGLALDQNFMNFIQNRDVSKLRVIVECNGYSAETYHSIHNLDEFETVNKNILNLAPVLKENLYVQIMKINETEPFLDAYYDYWEGHKVQIILQKQNTYCGRLTDRRYYDLTPLKRIPCWHLLRDLLILSDGSIPFCKQDPGAEFSLLSAKDMPILKIWEERKPLFVDNFNKKYAAKPDCKSCDEWFTFNL